jgi:hypothetical protein
MAYMHVIDSSDLELIGRWFAEKAKLLISANATYNHPVRLHIWPVTSQEQKLMADWAGDGKFTQDTILSLASYLTNISADWPHAETMPA